MATPSAPQRKVRIHNGWLKAQSYIAMNADLQRLYVMGELDGIYLAPAFGAPDDDAVLIRLESCIEAMSGSQIAAIVTKHIKDHPEKLNMDLKDVAYAAMIDACPTER